ncbi:MAG: hypothetical protein AAFX07_01670 [Pseudomonadota bacterium]
MINSNNSNACSVSALRVASSIFGTPRFRSAYLGATVVRLAFAFAFFAIQAPEAAAGPHKPALSHGEVRLAAPVQSALGKKKLYSKGSHQIEAIANFKIEARVLSAAKYRQGREAQVSQVDLALGWGKMATDSVLSKIDISQSGRFASMRYDPTSGIGVNDIVHNSSNMHMIPSSNAVDKALRQVKKGQIVQIEGYLVNIRHADGWRWLTSTSRTDQGNGACEIILVTSIKVLG